MNGIKSDIIGIMSDKLDSLSKEPFSISNLLIMTIMNILSPDKISIMPTLGHGLCPFS